MAGKLKAKKASSAPKAKQAKGGKKGSTPGVGHNYRIDRKVVKKCFDELDKRHRDKDESNAGYMADINATYERFAKLLGIPERIVKLKYKEHKHRQQEQNAYANLEPDERDLADGLQLALAFFKGSPIGKDAAERQELEAATANDDGADDDEEGAQPEPMFEDA